MMSPGLEMWFGELDWTDWDEWEEEDLKGAGYAGSRFFVLNSGPPVPDFFSPIPKSNFLVANRNSNFLVRNGKSNFLVA
jgi:hypothetical protein